MRPVRTVLLTEGAFKDDGMCKTAYGVLRFAPESVVAVIDSQYAGRDAFAVCGLGRGIPVVESLEAALAYSPTRMLIGVATVGGILPGQLREVALRALEKGLEVHNGLHEMLSLDPEMQAAAARGSGRIVDLRKEPDDLVVAQLRAQAVPAAVVLSMGTDCNAGKMTTAIQLVREAEARGIKAQFCATGQTGIAIAGWGIAIDHVLSDFTAGAAERLVCQAGMDHGVKLIAVEGQGALAQPVYSGVTLSLMHGSLPDYMLLCHRPMQKKIEIVDLPMPPLPEHIKLCEEAMRLVKPARVVGISLVTRGLDDKQARREVERASAETGLPATDPVRFGAGALLDALLEKDLKKVPLYSGPAS